MLGSPEGELVIAELVVYLALAPKSNAIYKAFNAAKLVAEQTGHLSPPKHVINPSTALMKAQDFGKGYQYDHDLPTGFSGQNYFPEELGIQEFYVPVERGFEREMQKRMDYFHRLKSRFQND
jgi:putative ATPase